MKSIGEMLKQVRENLGLTQEQIANKIASQSSIQKIESGKRNPSYNTIISITDKLCIPYDELLYVQNEFQLSTRNKLVFDFQNLGNSLHKDAFNQLNQDLSDYLNKHDDFQLRDLQAVLQSIICFQESQSFTKPRPIVKPIWDRLEKQDDWYNFDLYLLSHIFYIFEPETADEIIAKLLKNIDKYEHYNQNPKFKLSFLLNIVTYYRHHERILDSEKLIEQALEIARACAFDTHQKTAEYAKAEVLFLQGETKKATELANHVFSFFELLKNEPNKKAILDDLKNDWAVLTEKKI
ncbi:helix-turn-helix transcriptional regulator [Listeria booriae]|uniref:helix-turn-helix transcriptional regulator n=1 Tax=Listeria booriae TaxID=1552123 RepID=UPI00162AAB11|nr:helix-turn-helix transcriptional regulator [Listeria booriae]MBC1920488.1 helix-turn-helix transcriptional regulator [Listeria booriae]